MEFFKFLLAIEFIAMLTLCIIFALQCKTYSDKNKIDKAYIDGYCAGFKHGKQEAMFKKYSPNEIREALGLDPIKEDGTNV